MCTIGCTTEPSEARLSREDEWEAQRWALATRLNLFLLLPGLSPSLLITCLPPSLLTHLFLLTRQASPSSPPFGSESREQCRGAAARVIPMRPRFPPPVRTALCLPSAAGNCSCRRMLPRPFQYSSPAPLAVPVPRAAWAAVSFQSCRLSPSPFQGAPPPLPPSVCPLMAKVPAPPPCL